MDAKSKDAKSWLNSWHPQLHNCAIELCRESIPHQMFDRPVPWSCIRADLESFITNQEQLQKKIEQKRIEQGAAYKGGGLLELCVAGSSDYFLLVEYTTPCKI